MDAVENIAKRALSIIVVDTYKALLSRILQGPGSSFTSLVAAKMLLKTAETVARNDNKFDAQSWDDAETLASELFGQLEGLVMKKAN